MSTTIDDLIDLKDMAVAACYSLHAAFSEDAEPRVEGDLTAAIARARSAADDVIERAELYDAAEESDAVSIEDYEEREAKAAQESDSTDRAVVKRTPLREYPYPGWEVREYADGMFDAADTEPTPVSHQEQRREHLAELVETFHRDKAGDYEDTYEQFAADYFGVEADPDNEQEAEPPALEIPKYAAARGDETYGMLSCHDSLRGAIAAESEGIGEEYLNNPAGVYDLDTGKRLSTTTVSMLAHHAELLPAVIDDAISYRRSDDEDEDGEADNRQADQYAELLDLVRPSHDNQGV